MSKSKKINIVSGLNLIKKFRNEEINRNSKLLDKEEKAINGELGENVIKKISTRRLYIATGDKYSMSRITFSEVTDPSCDAPIVSQQLRLKALISAGSDLVGEIERVSRIIARESLKEKEYKKEYKKSAIRTKRNLKKFDNIKKKPIEGPKKYYEKLQKEKESNKILQD